MPNLVKKWLGLHHMQRQMASWELSHVSAINPCIISNHETITVLFFVQFEVLEYKKHKSYNQSKSRTKDND